MKFVKPEQNSYSVLKASKIEPTFTALRTGKSNSEKSTHKFSLPRQTGSLIERYTVKAFNCTKEVNAQMCTNAHIIK